MTEDDNPTAQALALVKAAFEKADNLGGQGWALEQRMRAELDQAIKNNPDIRRLETEEKEWRKAAEEAASGLLSVGTLIVYHGSYYVIESYNGPYTDCYLVTEKRSRKKYTDQRIYIKNIERIADYKEIADKKVRDNAKRLIARVRLKDW